MSRETVRSGTGPVSQVRRVAAHFLAAGLLRKRRRVGAILAGVTFGALASSEFPQLPVSQQRSAFKSAFAFGFSLASIAAVAATFIGTRLWVLRDSVLSEP